MVPSINRAVNGSACYCRSRIPLRRFKIPAEYQQPTLRLLVVLLCVLIINE